MQMWGYHFIHLPKGKCYSLYGFRKFDGFINGIGECTGKFCKRALFIPGGLHWDRVLLKRFFSVTSKYGRQIE